MDIRQILATWGINAVALVAGAIGSIVAITINDEEVNFKRALSQLGCGMAFSGYGTDIIVTQFSIDSASSIGVLGLALGILGMYGAKGLVGIGKRFAKNPVETITKLRNKK